MTTADPRPFILHVDDVPDDLRTWEHEVNSAGSIRLKVCHPRDVTEELLHRALVIFVDFRLDEWLERDNTDLLGLKPTNGLALLSVLQEAAYDLDKDRPRAFALFTAVVREVARGLVPQPHIVARAHNLEWIFDKTATSTKVRAMRARELATAVWSLPTPWPGDSPEHASTALQRWLALPDAPWRDAAWQAVMRCRPPMHAYAEHTHGIGVLRWALHRILPYPTFLLDDAHLAARLRVDLGSLRDQLEANTQLKQLLEPARYVGCLAAFSGTRWWRAAIESLIFELASKDPSSLDVLHEQLAKIVPDLRVIEAGIVFPVIDENFRVKNQLATAEEVVEVVPDDWPPFADSAWALRVDIEASEDLKAIAIDSNVEES